MTEKELIDRISAIGPTETQKDRMLNRILMPGSKPKASFKRSYKIAVPALCAAIVLILFAIPVLFDDKPAVPQLIRLDAATTPFSAPIQRGVFGIEPMSAQSYLNYNGNRYSFLDNGAFFDLSGVKLGPIADSMQPANGEGTIYTIPGYDPGFRLAVEREGHYRIAQFAGKSDDGVIAADEFLALADLGRLTERVEIMTHTGTELLHAIEGKKNLQALIKAIGQSKIADDWTMEDERRLAVSQIAGNSFMIKFNLKDGTAVSMHAMPELKLATIGNGRYRLSERFLNDYADLFKL